MSAESPSPWREGMRIDAFFDPDTFSVSYVLEDVGAKRCAIIDPVLDFDLAAGRFSYASAERIVNHVYARGLTVSVILDSHIHADHISAASYLKVVFGAEIGIGKHVVDVQRTFARILNLADTPTDGRPFDRLFEDNETFRVGGLDVRVLHTPGHTPGCVSYRVGDAVFVGDTLFMPDYGTARTDFPGGDARTFYHSLKRILALAPETRLFHCHDYKAPGRDVFGWESTVAEQRAANIHIHDGVGETDFVAMRTARDKTLAMPRLLWPAMQLNLRAGQLPPPEGNGRIYLKLPIESGSSLSRSGR